LVRENRSENLLQGVSLERLMESKGTNTGWQSQVTTINHSFAKAWGKRGTGRIKGKTENLKGGAYCEQLKRPFESRVVKAWRVLIGCSEKKTI